MEYVFRGQDQRYLTATSVRYLEISFHNSPKLDQRAYRTGFVLWVLRSPRQIKEKYTPIVLSARRWRGTLIPTGRTCLTTCQHSRNSGCSVCRMPPEPYQRFPSRRVLRRFFGQGFIDLVSLIGVSFHVYSQKVGAVSVRY